MFTVEFSVLLILSALTGALSLAHSLRTALPQVAGLRQALRDCPETLEMRFSIREVVVHYNDGKVVPLRPRRAISLPQRPAARAAA
jgi:hypothetical protein